MILQADNVPIVLNVLVNEILVYGICYEFLHHLENALVEILTVKNLCTLLVDDLTLSVHNIVVVEGILSYAEVVALDLLL